MAANIKIIRLLGEELLGDIVEENKDAITVKNIVRIIVIPNKTDPKSPSVAFAPFCDWTTDKQVVINKSLVITTMTPVSEFINQYNTTFGGLVVPDSKLILPGQ